MKKILVVGVSCSGKTSLGKEIAAIKGAKLVDIDELHWKPNWTPISKEELLFKVKESLQCSKWVITGNYSSLHEYLLKEVDSIIWLDYSVFVVAMRALKRTLRRIMLKESCCNGNYETFSQSFFSMNSIFIWVAKTYSKRKIQYLELMNDPKIKDKKFIRLKSPRETREFVKSLDLSNIYF